MICLKELDIRFFEALIDIIPNLVVILDNKGNIVKFNKEAEIVTGYKEKEVLYKNIFDVFIEKEELEDVNNVFIQLKEKKFPNRFINSWITKNGEKKLISWNNTCKTDDKNKVSFIIAIGTDITEKIKDAEKIRKIYDKIEIINKILIHDLQNALSVLQGYLDLYEETKDDLYFQSIKKIVEENFKTLKRMETATQSAEEFKQKKQRLTKIFEEMEERYQFFSDIVLHFDEIIDAEIKVDDNLYSIFDNLFMNSIMHGNAKNIFISSSKIKDKTNIILEDDSKISDIDIQKIIKDLDSYSLGKCSGLALVGKLMKNLNGEITVSKNEQGGIRIILSFPDLD
ncbi:MAG: PAS domain-containing sensor histidine kinase [Candidatus Heimdallarchaeaceae archaeon]